LKSLKGKYLTMDSKRLISIIVPAYDEEENIPELGRRLRAVFDTLPNYQFEVIIVDNGSRDKTWEMIGGLHSQDSRFVGLQLSRNFTAPGGVAAGFAFATGDAAVMLCADLQDPPEKIPEMITKWEEGYEIVYHLVSERPDVSVFRRWASNFYHSVMNRLTHGSLIKNASVFNLLDRGVYEALNDLPERNRYFPGLCGWVGFKKYGLEFPREPRFAGKAKSPFRVVFKLAVDGILAFSYAPLRLITYMGLTVSGGAFVFLFYLLFNFFWFGSEAVKGITTLICVNLFLFGLLFFALGVMGEYMARIYDEVKGRPNFIVKRILGVAPPPKTIARPRIYQ
jgi:polyisoprenyl-phosphate glycosyltransferase